MLLFLFDLQTDPNELVDLGDDPAYQEQVDRLRNLHFAWTRQHRSRITRSPEIIEIMSEDKEPPGIVIAYWEKELEADGLPMPSHVKR